ncbi:galactonate dehydratase [Lipomyces starkeyi]
MPSPLQADERKNLPAVSAATSDKIKSIEKFRVLPRWLFVKVETENGVAVEGAFENLGKGLLVGRPRTSKISYRAVGYQWQSSSVPVWQLLGGKANGCLTASNGGTYQRCALDWHRRRKQLARMLEPYQPLFIEESLLPDHVDELSKLYQQTTIPIALGERLFTRQMVRPYLESDCIDIIQPYISISETKRIATLAETYYGHIFEVKNGFVETLRGPGLGIDVDEDLVRKTSTETKDFSWRNPVWRSGWGIREW